MSEFSLESVRQYMLMRDGQVTNHELVKHFRAWLTHPTQKDISRQKFKEYVNTLATIKQHNGEKFLVLKPQFFPKFEDDEEEKIPEPSLLDEVMASYTPISSSNRRPPTQPPPPIPSHGPPPAAPPPRRQLPQLPNDPPPPPSKHRSQQPPLPPYRPPPPGPPIYRSPPSMYGQEQVGLPLPSDYGLPQPRQGVFHPPDPAPTSQFSPHYQPTQAVPPATPQSAQQSTPPALPAKTRESVSSSISLSSSVTSIQNRKGQDGSSTNSSSSVSRKNSTEDKENGPDASDSVRLTKKDEKISVKERTKTFNRMASEVDLAGGLKLGSHVNLSSMGVKRRNSRATERAIDESNDSSSISTLDQTIKQWMVKSAQGDYHGLLKMLRDDPRLAKAKDFVSGYTSLHWAAKHGNLDMVKMLAGNYSAPVNQKSHGGYTPLHLAAQFGHQEVFDILVKAYGADQNLRDNSGKKPRQYLVVQDQAMSMSSDTFQQLKDRRRQRRQNGGGKASVGGSGGMSRFGSLSVRVKKTTEAFNNYFNSRSESEPSSIGPISLPMELIAGGGTGLSSHTSGLVDDGKRVPPPKFAPSSLKKRKSKREQGGEVYRKTSAPATPTDHRSSIKEESKEELKRISTISNQSGNRSDSDSEYGFDSGWTPR